MLKTMMWQAALAALVTGGAAATYAQARGNGYLPAPQEAPREAKLGRDSHKGMEKGDRHAPRPTNREGRHHD